MYIAEHFGRSGMGEIGPVTNCRVISTLNAVQQQFGCVVSE
jgi:hypothetical protein